MRSPCESCRVVVADDHPFYRAGLTRQLRASGIDVVAEAQNAATAIRAVADSAPDVAIMDLNMPGLPGVEAIRLLGEQAPAAHVVVLTVSAEEFDVSDAMLAGAVGYVLKDDLPEDIVAAVRAAADGESLVSPRVASVLLARARGHPRARLGRQELDVLELLAEGRAEQEIVGTLVTSRHGVREHLVSILRKLAVDDLAALRVARGRLM